jgi:uncharacterized protein YndB with AHSA1/START domain
MAEDTAQVTIDVEASPKEIWEALVDPERIAEYFFGSTVTSDWVVGSPITFEGEWKGQHYTDKGKILVVEPFRHLSYSHWSPLSGTEDAPENYHLVDIELSEDDGSTEVRLTQSNVTGEVTDEDVASRAEYEANWLTVLEGLKRVVEH